jgi:protein-disulfide isomerase
MKTKSLITCTIAITLFLTLSSCKLVDLASKTLLGDESTPYPTYTFYPTYTPNAAESDSPVDPSVDSAFIQGMTMGDPNAPVKVIEFADFQCPWCQYFVLTLEPEFIANYVDEGLVYYTISPMAFLGQESVDAALAAYCANDQGKYWEYRQELFNNLNGENEGYYSMENLVAYAGNIGIDQGQFQVCLAAGEHQGDLNAADNFATQVGATFTPSFWVNGEVVSANDLDSAVEDALHN